MQKEKKKKEETDEMRQDIFLKIILVWILTFTFKDKNRNNGRNKNGEQIKICALISYVLKIDSNTKKYNL